MKVEIIQSDSSSELGSLINNFIKDKEVVNVSVDTCAVDFSFYYTACVLYKE